MNSKQKKEVQQLRAEVKLAHSEADKREVELRSAGLDNNSAIKVDPTFVDLSDKFWDLCLALECAKGKNPPVQNGREFQLLSRMQRHEREGVGLAKTARKEIAKVAASYEQLRKVQQGYPGEEVPLIAPPSLDPHPTVSSTSAQADLDFLSFPPISDEQFLAEYREASKPKVVLIGSGGPSIQRMNLQ